MAKSITKCIRKDPADLHFMFVIIGRTEGDQEDGHKFVIPCIQETQGGHLRLGVRLERLIDVKRELGQTHGKLFSSNLRRAKMYECEDDFYRMIEMIQDTTERIAPALC
jgi:hypothetical protein